MSEEHCGRETLHTKKRGEIHLCDWCGHKILIGEEYAKWLFYADGNRGTIYAHEECAIAWHKTCAENNWFENHGENERPSKNSKGLI